MTVEMNTTPSYASCNTNGNKYLMWIPVQTAKLFRFTTPVPEDRIELVQCDLESEDEIEEALGNAGVVVCTIGASEKEVFDVTGPYRIDFKASSNLIEAGKVLNLKQ